MEALFDTYQDLAGFWWLSLQLADELEAYIFKKYPTLDSKEIVRQVEALRKPTWLEEQSFGVKKIARLIQKNFPKIQPSNVTAHFVKENKSIATAIKKHVNTFEWFGTHHWGGEAYSEEKCLEEIQKILEKGRIAQKKVPKPKKTLPLFRLMAVLSFWRTHCAEVTAKVVFCPVQEWKKSPKKTV
ncbi:MAG: hypothetical protein HY393_03770 [Candidatus Diapherotrites archaeon]|nr:hypothetical protein [Candidatus Diapherotrites archaeon]